MGKILLEFGPGTSDITHDGPSRSTSFEGDDIHHFVQDNFLTYRKTFYFHEKIVNETPQICF